MSSLRCQSVTIFMMLTDQNVLYLAIDSIETVGIPPMSSLAESTSDQIPNSAKIGAPHCLNAGAQSVPTPAKWFISAGIVGWPFYVWPDFLVSPSHVDVNVFHIRCQCRIFVPASRGCSQRRHSRAGAVLWLCSHR